MFARILTGFYNGIKTDKICSENSTWRPIYFHYGLYELGDKFAKSVGSSYDQVNSLAWIATTAAVPTLKYLQSKPFTGTLVHYNQYVNAAESMLQQGTIVTRVGLGALGMLWGNNKASSLIETATFVAFTAMRHQPAVAYFGNKFPEIPFDKVIPIAQAGAAAFAGLYALVAGGSLLQRIIGLAELIFQGVNQGVVHYDPSLRGTALSFAQAKLNENFYNIIKALASLPSDALEVSSRPSEGSSFGS